MKRITIFFESFKSLEFLPVFIGAFLIGSAALLNKFPLVYPDTGSYFYYGLHGKVPYDRPLLYGLFLRHVSMRASVWLSLFGQTILVSSVLFSFIKLYFIKFNYKAIFYGVVLLLVLFTALSIKSSTLIPDAFTPLILLSFLILAGEKTQGLLRFWFSSILVFSIAVHLSHFMIVILTLVLYLLFKPRSALQFLKVPMIRQTVFLTCLVIVSIFVTPLINLKYAGTFFWSKTSNVFLMGRFAENGILNDYLDCNCQSKSLELCKYKGHIPFDFLWDNESPLYKMGGWEEPSAEFDFIVKDILLSPNHRKRIVSKSILQTIQQFASFQISNKDENVMLGYDSAPHCALRDVFSHEMPQYLSSNQNQGKLNYGAINQRQNMLLLVLSILLIYVFWKYWREFQQSSLNKFILPFILFCFSNAAICGTLSVVTPRYQTRVFWLLPFLFVLILVEIWLKSRTKSVEL